MIPKSYSVQDGCHNCKNCYKTTRFYCNIDKEKEEKNITIDSLQVDPSGNCHEWVDVEYEETQLEVIKTTGKFKVSLFDSGKNIKNIFYDEFPSYITLDFDLMRFLGSEYAISFNRYKGLLLYKKTIIGKEISRKYMEITESEEE